MAVQSLLKEARIKPQINQIEGHIYFRSVHLITCMPTHSMLALPFHLAARKGCLQGMAAWLI